MKYLGTLGWTQLKDKVKKYVDKQLCISSNYNTNYRIVCKCRGIKHGNELTQSIAYNPFNYKLCAVTGNKKELEYFKDPNVTFIITRDSYGSIYITDIQLKEAGVI